MTTAAALVSHLKNTKALSLPVPGTGSRGLQFSSTPMPLEGGTHLGWVSRWGGDSLVVMEDDENQIPVTIEEVPAEPGHGVGLEDEGQDTQVGDGHDGAGQHNHQHHEYLPTPGRSGRCCERAWRCPEQTQELPKGRGPGWVPIQGRFVRHMRSPNNPFPAPRHHSPPHTSGSHCPPASR